MELMNALPAAIREELRGLDMSRACDIRLLADRPCAVTTMEGEIRTCACVSGQEIYDAAQALSRRTLRMSPASTGAGFLTLRGGHRMGLCGRVTCERDGLVLREIGSLCLRIAHEVKGCGADTVRMLRGGGALIAGPPGSGKTTLLRDIVRILSDEGTAVGLCDERGKSPPVWRECRSWMWARARMCWMAAARHPGFAGCCGQCAQGCWLWMSCTAAMSAWRFGTRLPAACQC